MRDESGFTLLEVMVALLIAAMALAVLFQGASTGLQSAGTAGRYQNALMRARSHLASIGAASGVAPVSQEGDDGSGFRWALQVSPVASASLPSGNGEADDGAAGQRLTLYQVEVTVSWMAGRSRRQVRLESRRLGAAAGGGR